MSPLYLNPSTSSFSLLELKEDQTLQLFISPSSHHHHHHHHHPATTSSIPCGTFSNNRSTIQDQVHDGSAFGNGTSEIIHPEKGISFCGGTTDRHVFPSSSTHHQSIQDDGHEFESHKSSINDLGNNGDRHHYHQSGNGDYGIKWMSPKMRFMQKMKSNTNCAGSNDHKPIKVVHKYADHHRRGDDSNHSGRFSFMSNNIGNIRVCADCNTTTTPLWRSGPRGPKSLCNACGIRQRKARRAMEEAAAAAASGVAVTSDGSTSTARMIKVHNKDKKPRSVTHVGHYKKHGKATVFDNNNNNNHHVHGEKKMLFKNLGLGLGENSGFRQVFSQDVAEAAILLMELSCGLVHG